MTPERKAELREWGDIGDYPEMHEALDALDEAEADRRVAYDDVRKAEADRFRAEAKLAKVREAALKLEHPSQYEPWCKAGEPHFSNSPLYKCDCGLDDLLAIVGERE